MKEWSRKGSFSGRMQFFINIEKTGKVYIELSEYLKCTNKKAKPYFELVLLFFDVLHKSTLE
jgi:hypothetical protein